MGDEGFIRLLEKCGIPKSTGNERDYIKARAVLHSAGYESDDYIRLVQVCAKYVGV